MKPSLTQRERARNLLSSVKHFSCFSLAEFPLYETGAFIAGILAPIEVHNKKKQYIDIEPVLEFQHQVQEPQQPVKNLVQTGCLPLQKMLSSAVGSETATALSSVVNPPANSLVSIPIPATPFSQPQLLPAPATTNASPAIKIKLKIGPASKLVKNNVNPNPEVVPHIVSEKPSAEPTISPLSTNSTYPERSPVLDERLLFQEPTSSKVAKPNQGKCTPVAKTLTIFGYSVKKIWGPQNGFKAAIASTL